ncbi:uncharacterized protein Z518_01089 [Rhinocladiella mackenziei CBS 650.93]|uniref:Peroxisomal AMP binding enzyme n=1 Tax=Rhinocladiella mackenziei CBS 650.93 TaxID=1442369 RepID=A0A0D2HHC1_9EURO|nr:uncharacterized protein Z518_01089 [Rhinocladiella mackenziei CBS 650.93]KIX10008.1 hypothetical protein Z518_01089 [Rhinocladiella mackenziei CBS 650.93]
MTTKVSPPSNARGSPPSLGYQPGTPRDTVKDEVSLPGIPLFLEARSHALTVPNKAAIIDTSRNETFTYPQLLNDAAMFMTEIQKLLRSSNDPSILPSEEPRVAYLVPPGYDYVVVQWAIWAAGAICVPLCTSHPIKELQHTISDSDPSLIILYPSFQKLKGGLRARRPETPIMVMTPVPKLPTTKSMSLTLPRFSASFPLSRRAMMIYTSGTTSRPKGCVTTHSATTFQTRSLVEAWGYSRADHLIHVLPLHHVHGIVNGLTATLLAGGTVEMHSTFDPKIVWDRWSEKGSSTMFMAVPTVYARLIEYFDTRIRGDPFESVAREGAKSLRLVVSGSAALPVSIKRNFHEITGHELLERYGMTEVGMALSCGLDSNKRIDGSVGWPLPDVQVRLVDPETSKIITLSGNEEAAGLLEIKGPNLFAEYFRQPSATAESFTQDGWFKTGDVARRDAGGAYFILGRESVDLIKSGGYKISALEVEKKILGNARLCSIVDEVVVVGVNDADWGQRVAAIVKMKMKDRAHATSPRSDPDLDLATLRTCLREDMAPYKMPTILKVADSIERNAMGKVDKKQIIKKHFGPKL